MKGSVATLATPAALFQKAFRVLHVDDEETVLSLVRVLFEGLPLFDLHTSHTAMEAERKLSFLSYHMCFCDLGIFDSSGDQYYLVKKFGASLPIFILSGRASMEESAHGMSAGAAWVYDKPATLDRDFFSAILNRFLPQALFLYGTSALRHTRYHEVMDALFSHKPLSVEEWARIVNVNERYLRKICMCCPLPLHHIVHTFHLIDAALQSCASGAATALGNENSRRSSHNKKLMEFYYLNRNAIDSFLRIREST